MYDAYLDASRLKALSFSFPYHYLEYIRPTAQGAEVDFVVVISYWDDEFFVKFVVGSRLWRALIVPWFLIEYDKSIIV
jgi:hypothetical protein